MSYDRKAGKYDRKPRYQDVLGERVFVQSPEVEEKAPPLFYHGVQIHPDGQPIEWYSSGPLKLDAWLDRMRGLYTLKDVSRAMLDGIKLEYVMCQDGFEKMEGDLGGTRDKNGRIFGPMYQNEPGVGRICMLFKGIPVIWAPDVPFAHIYLRERKTESKVQPEKKPVYVDPTGFRDKKNRDKLWDLYGVTVKEEQGRAATLLVAGLCNGCGRPQGNPGAEPPKGWDKYLSPAPRHYRCYNEETGGEICGVFTYIAVPVSLQDQIENRGAKLLDLFQFKIDILLRKRSEKGHLFRAAQIEMDRLRGRPNTEVLGLRGLIPTDPADVRMALVCQQPRSSGVIEGLTT